MTKMKKHGLLLLSLLMALTLLFSGCAEYSSRNSSSEEDASSASDTTASTTAPSDSSTAEITTKPEQAIEATPLIWEVKSNDGSSTLYLFGSIHATDGTVFPFSDKIMNAYNSADCLAVEFDLIAFGSDMTAQLNTTRLLAYADGSTVKDHLSAETYEKVTSFLKEQNLYTSMYDNYHPMMLESALSVYLISDAGLSDTAGVDRYFLELAKNDGKEIIEIESAESQLQMAMSIPDEYYDKSLAATVDSLILGNDDMVQLYETWKTGDIDGFNAMFSEEAMDFTEEEQYIYDEYMRLMLTDRNTLMTQTADNILKSGKNGFLVVGVAHMIGDTGIVKQLEDMGYTVTRI